jgi:hypothetical protein
MGVIKLPKAHECILPLKWPLKVGTVWECTAKLDGGRCRKRWELAEDDGRKIWFPMTPAAPTDSPDGLVLPEVPAEPAQGATMRKVSHAEALYWVTDSLPPLASSAEPYTPAQVLNALIAHYDIVARP